MIGYMDGQIYIFITFTSKVTHKQEGHIGLFKLCSPIKPYREPIKIKWG